MNETNVTHMSARRPDAARPSAVPGGAVPLSGDLHLSDFIAARRRTTLIAEAKRVEQRLHADKLRYRELAQARDDGFKKGQRRGYAQGRHWGLLLGLLAGMVLGGGLVGLFIRAGMHAAAGT